MTFPWETHLAESGSSPHSEMGTQLEVIPPLPSPETQQRNGVAPSILPDRGDRIMEDIKNRLYDCSICIERIECNAGNHMNSSQALWQCRACHNVYHYVCVKTWSTTRRNIVLQQVLQPSWKCPNCFIECGNPEPTCWCGKHSSFLRAHDENRPNSCLQACERMNSCPHGERIKCDKKCHPGPCNIPCVAACTRPQIIPRFPAWSRFCARFRARKKRSLRRIIFFTSCLIIIYSTLAVFILKDHIPWRVKSYKYPNFQKDWSAKEFPVILLATFLIAPVNAFLSFSLHRDIGQLAISTLNLNSQRNKRIPKRITKFLGGSLLALVLFGLLVSTIVGLAGGPDIAWYNQMKNSCNGFNTRMALDYSIADTTPRTKFTAKSLSPDIAPYDLYLASHLDTQNDTSPSIDHENSTNEFEYFQRLSFSRPSLDSEEWEHLAIDVDIPNALYRILIQNVTDGYNQFLASGYQDSATEVPKFHPVSQRTMTTGNFSIPTAAEPHLYIPDLSIGISNMHAFIENEYVRPFIRIYRNLAPAWEASDVIHGGDQAFKASLDQEWNSGNAVYGEHLVVARTASFGHGRQRLDVCVREEGDGVVSYGVNVEDLVPVAILAAWKTRAMETEAKDED